MTKNKHYGASLESLLAEDDLLDEASLFATKTVIAAQIAAAMKEKGLTKVTMATEMQITRAQLDRLLDPKNDSVTLGTLKRAAKALGRSLRLELA